MNHSSYILPKDIVHKVNILFAKESKVALKLIYSTNEENIILQNDRIMRCIVFLSNGDIAELKNYINAAVVDFRDVIYYAEYINETRVRNFNLPF